MSWLFLRLSSKHQTFKRKLVRLITPLLFPFHVYLWKRVFFFLFFVVFFSPASFPFSSFSCLNSGNLAKHYWHVNMDELLQEVAFHVAAFSLEEAGVRWPGFPFKHSKLIGFGKLVWSRGLMGYWNLKFFKEKWWDKNSGFLKKFMLVFASLLSHKPWLWNVGKTYSGS